MSKNNLPSSIFFGLTENSPAFIGIADQTGQVVYVNPAGLKMVGLSSLEEAQSKKIFDFTTPEYQQRIAQEYLPEAQQHGSSTGIGVVRHFETRTTIPINFHLFMVDGHLVIVMNDRSAEELALRRLEEAEQNHRQVLEQMTDNVWRLSLETMCFTYTSPSVERLIGYTPEEILEMPLSSILPEPYYQKIQEEVERALLDAARGTEVIRQLEVQLIHKEGHRVWVGISANLMFNEQGIPAEVLGVSRDVGVQKAAYQTLHSMVQGSPDPTFALDLDGRVIVWNKALELLTGVPAGKIMSQRSYSGAFYSGKNFVVADVVLGRCSLESIQDNYEEIRSNGQGGYEAKTFIPSLNNGKGAYVWIQVSPFSDEKGQMIGVIETVRDVTEQRQSEETMKQIFSAFPHAVFLVNSDRKITMANEKAKGMMGGLSGSTFGQSIQCVWLEGGECGRSDSCSSCRIRDPLFSTLNGKGVEEFRIEQEIEGGRKLVFLLSTAQIYVQGSPCAVMMLQDITEAESVRSQLLQAQKMEGIGRLASGVAHDFNNLIGAIIGNAGLALDSEEDELPILLNIVIEAGQRAANLTRQLLLFSRKQKMEVATLNLNSLFNDFHKMLARLVGEDVSVVWRPDAKLPNIKGDKGQIEQIMLNLAVNARDAMPKGGEIIIRTKLAAVDGEGEIPKGVYACLSVSDTGAGIPPEILANIFDPFFTTKEEGKGTGLGLATVQTIVQNHDAFISVESEEGKGTAFKIFFPVTGEELSRIESGRQELVCGSGTILIVEDDQMLREMDEKFLSRLGYSFLSASNGAEAIHLVETWKEGKIDLILSDVVLPGVSGPEMLEQLLPKLPGCKVLLVSGYTPDTLMQHPAVEKYPLLKKPVGIHELSRAIHDILNS